MVDLASQMALETIRDLLIEEFKFLSGVSGQADEVQRKLNTIHSLLKDADARPGSYKSNIVCKCVADLKSLHLKAEDVLEQYYIEVRSKSEGRNLKAKLIRFACILSECVSKHQVGKKIQVIRSRMDMLIEDLRVAKEESSSNSTDHNQDLGWRLTHAHEVEQYFVDTEHVERLLKRVLDVKSSNRLISVYGMGGLGKTTLAQKMYQNKEVQRRFEARAWVCVSQRFDAKSVLKQILKQLNEKEVTDNMELSEYVAKLYKIQMEKKCFIVIDDIWETRHWEILRPAFPIIEGDCKVLLTTRNEKIVSKDYLYELGNLTEDQGWELLQKIALPGDSAQGHQLETIGREMVKKCGYLPLAISVIGGSLRQKQTLSEWKKVNVNIDVYLKQGEGVGKDKRVEQVLDLSYNALPYYLKPCFLYLGCFPEDEEIDAERLYLLWMAEGMISSEDKGSRETLRDVAERYLSELAFRCMVQVEVPEYSLAYRKFESCRLHDLMRDLCLSKATKERFLKVIDFKEATGHVSSPTGDIPRLAFHLDKDRYSLDINFNEREKLQHTRSLLILWKVGDVWSSTMLDRETNFNKFKFLRILIIESCEFEDGRALLLLREVGKLGHLRYLSLEGCKNVGELPRSICNLPYLHTLNLNTFGTSLKLPNMICKMKRLRHLFLGQDYETINGEKLRLDGLNELETLEGFSSDFACAADIPKLTNLRTFEATIEDKESLLIIANHISNNESQLLRETALRIDIWNSSLVEEGPSVLRKLFMSHSLVYLEFIGRIGCNLPCYEPAGFGTNLLQLTLSGSEIEEDVMETLGKFPMLSELRLDSRSFMGTELICDANAFPQLKSLRIDEMHNLKKWRVDKGAMPNLSKLEISECMKLEMMPDGLRHITTLQELIIYNMPKEFNDRLRVVNGAKGQDYDKVCHIPSISFKTDSD